MVKPIAPHALPLSKNLSTCNFVLLSHIIKMIQKPYDFTNHQHLQVGFFFWGTLLKWGCHTSNTHRDINSLTKLLDRRSHSFKSIMSTT